MRSKKTTYNPDGTVTETKQANGKIYTVRREPGIIVKGKVISRTVKDDKKPSN